MVDTAGDTTLISTEVPTVDSTTAVADLRQSVGAGRVTTVIARKFRVVAALHPPAVPTIHIPRTGVSAAHAGVYESRKGSDDAQPCPRGDI